MNDHVQRFERNACIVELNKELYSTEAITAAAYKFTDQFHIHIDDLETGRRSVKMTPKIIGGKSRVDWENTMGELLNEILDQQLRFHLAHQSGHIRDLIVEHAFKPITNLKEKLGE